MINVLCVVVLCLLFIVVLDVVATKASELDAVLLGVEPLYVSTLLEIAVNAGFETPLDLGLEVATARLDDPVVKAPDTAFDDVTTGGTLFTGLPVVGPEEAEDVEEEDM